MKKVTSFSAVLLSRIQNYFSNVSCFTSGPSFAMDTACSSSLLALDQAVNSIRQGHCDAAIVGGCSLCLKPLTALQFLKLGMLSPDGSCKSFDASGKNQAQHFFFITLKVRCFYHEFLNRKYHLLYKMKSEKH